MGAFGLSKRLKPIRNLVPHWATLEHFSELDQRGLMMYGQMTAGSWIYIGSQGIVQGTFETFAEMARQHFGGSAKSRWILTAGLGGMGGAQPLAATMSGFSMIAVECNQASIEFRLKTRYLDAWADTVEDALNLVEKATARKASLCAEYSPGHGVISLSWIRTMLNSPTEPSIRSWIDELIIL